MMSTWEKWNLTQPYPGLRPFLRTEAELFFGRADQINRMLARLEENRFLAVVGGSGSGKSSLVRAGLLPVLSKGYLLGAGTDWRFVVMRPGGDPFGNLAKEFHHTVTDDTDGHDTSDIAFTQAALQTSPRGFLEVVEEAGLDKGVPLLLLVDQFEEIFRFRRRHADAGPAGEGERAVHEERNDAAAFVNLLLTTTDAAAQTELPIYVVITMRSDFIGDCDAFPDLPQAISDSQFLVPRLTRRQMQEVIEKPLLLFGATAAPDLVNQMLNDAGTDPDQLPLMQHALMRTWFAAKARWGGENEDKVLTLDDYSSVGRFSGALCQHLEEAWDSLTGDRERRIAQQLFICLSARAGEGALIRRMMTLGEVATVAHAEPDELIKVVRAFQEEGRNFIVATPSGALSAESVLDISHEALLRQWPRLGEWLDEEARSAETYRRLVDSAVRHAADQASLLRGRELRLALEWREKQRPTAAWANLYQGRFDTAIGFLRESKAQRDAEEVEQVRSRRLRRTGQAGVLLIVLSIILGSWYQRFSEREEEKREELWTQQRRVQGNQTLYEIYKIYKSVKSDDVQEDVEPTDALQADPKKELAELKQELESRSPEHFQIVSELPPFPGKLAKRDELLFSVFESLPRYNKDSDKQQQSDSKPPESGQKGTEATKSRQERVKKWTPLRDAVKTLHTDHRNAPHTRLAQRELGRILAPYASEALHEIFELYDDSSWMYDHSSWMRKHSNDLKELEKELEEYAADHYQVAKDMSNARLQWDSFEPETDLLREVYLSKGKKRDEALDTLELDHPDTIELRLALQKEQEIMAHEKLQSDRNPGFRQYWLLAVTILALPLWFVVQWAWRRWEGRQRRPARVDKIKAKPNPFRRAAAGAIDLLFATIIGGLLSFFTWWAAAYLAVFARGEPSGDFWALAAIEDISTIAAMVVFVVVMSAYLLFRDAVAYRFNRSIGKIMLKLLPITLDGRLVTMKVSAKRNWLLLLEYYLAVFLSGFFLVFVEDSNWNLPEELYLVIFLVVLSVILLVMELFSRNLRDRMANTKVIDVRCRPAMDKEDWGLGTEANQDEQSNLVTT